MSELSTDQVYTVVETEYRDCRHGRTLIVSLQDNDGTTIRIHSTPTLQKELEKITESAGDDKRIYIKYNGQQTASGSGNNYSSFTLLAKTSH